MLKDLIKKIKVKEKGMFNCPECGSLEYSLFIEWVLSEIKAERKRMNCKRCRRYDFCVLRQDGLTFCSGLQERKDK
jgi:transcription elongation factor Elf1